MRLQGRFLISCAFVASCSMLFAQANSAFDQQTVEDKHVTEEFGNCTLGYGKDSDRYVQPYITCTSGNDTFALFGREDGRWGVLLSPTYETDRTDDGEMMLSLTVTISVDDNDAHEFYMWATEWNVVLDRLETSEVAPLFDELRGGRSLTITRKDKEIVFDVERANHAFADLFFKQSVALSKVETAEGQ